MTHRLRNRFGVAVALAVLLAGARAFMSSAAPSGFPELPNLLGGEGEPVTIAVAATGFPDVTYSATGLPPGINISTGVDSNGHVSGFLTGTLPVGAPGTDPQTSGAAYTGSEGIYNVTISASDGSSSNTFTWDIGRWAAGDVFVGIGLFRYQIYSKDGVFKYEVVTDEPRRFTVDTYLVDENGVWVPDENGQPQPLAPELGGQVIAENGITSGCASNWHTGETWAANFDDKHPGINVITRHAGANARPYTDISRRLSTERYSLDQFGNQYAYPDNSNPESVAFDNADNMLVGHSFGFYNNDGEFADENGQAVWQFDPQGQPLGFVTVDAAGFPIFMQDGNPVPWDQPVSPTGFYETWAGALVLGQTGLPIPLREQKGMDLYKFPVQSGNNYSALSGTFNTRYGYTGTDAIDLMSDQRTIVYTSESRYMYRYDVAASAQLPVVGASDVNNPFPIFNARLYGVRVLPPGDGTGGYLVATWNHLLRVDDNGRVLQSYDIQDREETPADEGVDSWFSLAIAPDGRTFWAASLTGWVYRFDVASGRQVGDPIRATSGVVHTNAELAAMCVMNEYRAAQEVCGANGLGNGIDDDRDGLIDEGCFRIETCSVSSPGDDDGDGLVDFNDPDCGVPQEQVCTAGGPTADNIAGFCERANVEGETLSIAGIDPPCVGTNCDAWTLSYSADNLPTGLTMDPTTGRVTGVPVYSIVNPNRATSAPVVFPVTVHVRWQLGTYPATTFDKSFPWTIYNANRPPVAVDDGPYSTNAGGSVSVDVRVNDSDPDTNPPFSTDIITVSGFTQPSNGSVVQVGQNLVYTAPLGFSGTVTFLYQLTDDYDTPALSNWATVTVLVNDKPQAVDDHYTTPEDTPITASVVGNDTLSADGGNVWTRISNPSNGTVTSFNAAGTFTYVPNPNFHGTDSFLYRLCDASGDCVTATVTITIVSVNDLPVANDDAYTTPEDTPITASVVGNDVLSGDGGNVWSKTSDPSNGTVTFNANGTFTYTPNANFHGTDSFNYLLCDVDNDCDPATVTITITDVNDVPLAVNDAYTTPEDTPITRNASINDTPSGDGGNVWTRTSNPANGTVTAFNPDGTFTYVPNANFHGTDSFTYKVCDVDNDCATATVTITITSVNDLPVANDDSYTTPEDTPVVSTVVGNDVLSGDGGNVWTKTSNPSNGTVVLNADGSFVYTPNANFHGTDSFNYRICDVDNDCDPATVTITIISVNEVPLAVDDAFTTNQNTPITTTVTGNDTPSPDGGNVWTKLTNPTNGTVVFNANGTFTYTPNPGFHGVDSFRYSLCDVDNDCATATVTITIVAVNAVPLAVNDAYTTPEDTPVTASVVGNDTPSLDGGNVWTRTSDPSNGTVTSFNPDGTFTYVPNTNFHGTDSFTYKVCDVDNDCAPATVTITITSVNDVPLAVNDAYTTPEDTPVTADVSVNDTPSGDGGNVWTRTSNPSNGTVTSFNPDGTFTYVPNANFFGTDSFTYKVCDVDNDCATATVTITITPVNDVPVANDDAYTTPEDTPITASVVGNDVLSGDGGNVWTKTSNPANGTVTSFNANGTFTYTPNANFNGTDSFTYLLCDVDNDCDPATVTITITPANDVPVAVNDYYTTPMNTPVTSGVQTNDTPSGDGGNVWLVVTPPTSGSVTFSTTGAFTYTPATNAFGTFTFTYKVCDVDGDCSTALVTIVIPAPCGTGPFTTYTQGGWGSKPTGGNPGALLVANFSTVFPVGYVQIGTSARYLRFTSASAVEAFLPQGGTAGVLTASAVNPTKSSANVFGGQVLALQLSVGFSDAGIKRLGLRNQVVASGTLAGSTVGEVLALANAVLAGGALPSGVTLTALNDVVDAINNNYDNGLANDGFLNDDPACAATNNVPVARDDAYTMTQATVLTSSVATNDTPSTDGGNVWSLVSGAANGIVSLSTNGNFTYTPATTFSGSDTFTYKVCDAQNDCATAVAVITITPCNDVPTATNDTYTVANTATLSGDASLNDDPSNDGGNTWTKTSSPSSGTAVMNANGTFTYTPVSGFTGTVSFTYKICDVNVDCSTATVTITVTGNSTSTAYATYTQGGWGAAPSGANPGALLSAKFATVYGAAGYVQIGSTKYLRFTSASAIERYLPAGGTAAKLSSSATNPKSSGAGVFAGQVLALQLNVDFSKAGITTAGLDKLKVKSGKLAGYTVQQVLDLANSVLGGSYTLPSTITISDLNAIVDAINKNYDNGTTNNGYLG